MNRFLDEEQNLLAAEHALGVLADADLTRARELTLSSPEFAQAVQSWELALAPIADEAAEKTPPDGLWKRIEQSAESRADQTNVHELGRSVRRWKGVSFAAMAVAAAMVLFVATSQGVKQAPVVDSPQSVLIASLSSEETNSFLSAAYDPARRSVLVTPGKLVRLPGRQHELWVIPQGGAPVPVGLLDSDQPKRLAVRSEIMRHFRGRATLAVSVEPMCGSPTGQPTGPVIAAGELLSI